MMGKEAGLTALHFLPETVAHGRYSAHLGKPWEKMDSSLAVIEVDPRLREFADLSLGDDKGRLDAVVLEQDRDEERLVDLVQLFFADERVAVSLECVEHSPLCLRPSCTLRKLNL